MSLTHPGALTMGRTWWVGAGPRGLHQPSGTLPARGRAWSPGKSGWADCGKHRARRTARAQREASSQSGLHHWSSRTRGGQTRGLCCRHASHQSQNKSRPHSGPQFPHLSMTEWDQLIFKQVGIPRSLLTYKGDRRTPAPDHCPSGPFSCSSWHPLEVRFLGGSSP